MTWNLSFDEYSAQSSSVCWGGVHTWVHALTSLPSRLVALSGRYIVFSFEVNGFDAEIIVVVLFKDCFTHGNCSYCKYEVPFIKLCILNVECLCYLKMPAVVLEIVKPEIIVLMLLLKYLCLLKLV